VLGTVIVVTPEDDPFNSKEGAAIGSVDVIVAAVVIPSFKWEFPVKVVADPAKGIYPLVSPELPVEHPVVVNAPPVPLGHIGLVLAVNPVSVKVPAVSTLTFRAVPVC